MVTEWTVEVQTQKFLEATTEEIHGKIYLNLLVYQHFLGE